MVTHTLAHRAALIVVVAATIGAALAGHGQSAQAQPVAAITLPNPGGTEQLYPWCNNISLTFPDGTSSQNVVQAVTPTGAVESMWRHNRAQNRFEGFSPAYPQASDLLTVNFLDSVWLCIAEVPGASAPPPGQPPPPLPPGGGTWGILTTDLAVTDVFIKPDRTAWLRLTNNGPSDLTNVTVDVRCEMDQMELANPMNVTGMLSQFPQIVTLTPGQTQEYNAQFAQLDFTKYAYGITCRANVGFDDPILGNNVLYEAFPQP